ncbi:hypothetical protein [Gimesia sp.]|uniref:hypothetical protein n=1 Tax=Gimesia sp. TaxID=2024833 RepID=UPI003A937B6F
MTDLLTKHGAATKLGITAAALGKLVRDNKIPFIALPNGEIRFDSGDLIKWVQTLKEGGMTVAIDKRAKMQEQLRKRPEYIKQRDEILEEQKQVQSKVDAGLLTQLALVPIENRLKKVLSLINNDFRNQLINSCTNQDLHDEWRILNEEKIRVDREIHSEKMEAERIETDIRLIQSALTELHSADGPGKETEIFKPFDRESDGEYQDRINQRERKLILKQQELERCNARIAQKEEELNRLESEKQRVRDEMVFD